MKILHVIPSVAARYGGPSIAVVEMCRALNERGVSTLIATTDADGDGRLDVKLEKLSMYQDVETIFFSRQWSEAVKYSRPLARWLTRNVRYFDAVHIHAVFSHACLSASTACRPESVPYIVRPLGTLDPWSLSQKRRRKQLFLNSGGRRMLKEASAIHYTTQSEMRLAEQALGLQHGVVIPLGVDEAYFERAHSTDSLSERHPEDEHPYVLVLSRLHPKKGLELLIDVFLQLARSTEFESWKLLIAGDGDADYVASLRQQAAEGGASARVLFKGWLDGEAKISALRGAALLALPSRQENFGLCVAEALACGTPVLVSRHVNLADEIEKAGCGWVVPLDRDALMHSLAEAMRDAPARNARGGAGQSLARRRFRWAAVADGLYELYVSISQNRAKHPVLQSIAPETI